MKNKEKTKHKGIKVSLLCPKVKHENLHAAKLLSMAFSIFMIISQYLIFYDDCSVIGASISFQGSYQDLVTMCHHSSMVM